MIRGSNQIVVLDVQALYYSIDTTALAHDQAEQKKINRCLEWDAKSATSDERVALWIDGVFLSLGIEDGIFTVSSQNLSTILVRRYSHPLNLTNQILFFRVTHPPIIESWTVLDANKSLPDRVCYLVISIIGYSIPKNPVNLFRPTPMLIGPTLFACSNTLHAWIECLATENQIYLT